MNLVANATASLGDPGRWEQGEPLWKRAPKRDAEGRPYVDFMMLAPGLRKRPTHEILCLTHTVQGVLVRFREWIVFADLNLKLNVLWVSHKYRPGLMAEIVTALRLKAPEFKLVALNPDQRR